MDGLLQFLLPVLFPNRHQHHHHHVNIETVWMVKMMTITGGCNCRDNIFRYECSCYYRSVFSLVRTQKHKNGHDIPCVGAKEHDLSCVGAKKPTSVSEDPVLQLVTGDLHRVDVFCSCRTLSDAAPRICGWTLVGVAPDGSDCWHCCSPKEIFWFLQLTNPLLLDMTLNVLILPTCN